MNIYGVVTNVGNVYTLNVAEPPNYQLSIGDTVTIRPLAANTGAASLSIGGDAALPITLNGNALTSGQLAANVDRQLTFVGSSFAADNGTLVSSDLQMVSPAVICPAADGWGVFIFGGESKTISGGSEIYAYDNNYVGTLTDGSPAGGSISLRASNNVGSIIGLSYGTSMKARVSTLGLEMLAPLYLTGQSILCNTTSGSDNSFFSIFAGGAANGNRGAGVSGFGNQYGSSFDGFLQLAAGNISGSEIIGRIGSLNRMRVKNITATNEAGLAYFGCGVKTRVPSTSYNLLAVTANTTGQVILTDSTMTGNAITTVTLKQGTIAGIAGDTTCYKTTAPTGDQCQLTISGGFLVATTGNTYARKLGVTGIGIGEEGA